MVRTDSERVELVFENVLSRALMLAQAGSDLVCDYACDRSQKCLSSNQSSETGEDEIFTLSVKL